VTTLASDKAADSAESLCATCGLPQGMHVSERALATAKREVPHAVAPDAHAFVPRETRHLLKV
jgi:hypothetical protein